MSPPLSIHDAGVRMLLAGRTRLATSMLQRAVDLDPQDAAARHSLALALRAQGSLTDALAQAAASVRLRDSGQGRALLGMLRLDGGDRAEGIALLQSALHEPLAPAVAARARALLAGSPVPAVPLAAELWSAPTSTAPEALARLLSTGGRFVAMTGAGITPSGRRRQLWGQLHRDDAASVWRFRENPVYLWSILASVLDEDPAPGPAHHHLARLPLSGIVTQGIGGLHQRAGGPPVIELHGALTRTRCDGCGAAYRVPVQGYLGGTLPPLCACGAPIRPDVLLCGETAASATVQSAGALLRSADVILVAGCAVDIEPAAGLLHDAVGAGVTVVHLGPEPTRVLAEVLEMQQ